MNKKSAFSSSESRLIFVRNKMQAILYQKISFRVKTNWIANTYIDGLFFEDKLFRRKLIKTTLLLLGRPFA